MPKKTFLEVVQYVSNKINSDEVNDLNDDSIEVQDIASIALEVLEDIMTRRDWEFLKDRPMALLAGTNKVEMTIPTNVQQVQTVKYAVNDAGVQKFRTLKYLYPDDYLCRLQSQNPAEPNIETIMINGEVPVYIRNNREPSYWTTFNESTVMFDSYDIGDDLSGLDASKSAILATIYLDFSGSKDSNGFVNDWVAPIPEKLFPYWLQESAAEASTQLRQTEAPREERRARRSYVQAIKREPVTQRDEGSREVNYGR